MELSNRVSTLQPTGPFDHGDAELRPNPNCLESHTHIWQGLSGGRANTRVKAQTAEIPGKSRSRLVATERATTGGRRNPVITTASEADYMQGEIQTTSRP